MVHVVTCSERVIVVRLIHVAGVCALWLSIALSSPQGLLSACALFV